MGHSGRVSTVLLRVTAAGDTILSAEGMREVESRAEAERATKQALAKELHDAKVRLFSLPPSFIPDLVFGLVALRG